jgi:dephospho-CoA kinase
LNQPRPHAWMPIIGLAGGIGAGKSAAAHALQRLGCVVSDSDARAKALLDRPDIRARLVQWWGPRVTDAMGRIDRRAVAGIIFADPAERARLEGLIHPILKLEREVEAERAKRDGAAAFIVDAPLLFEAGLHEACDAVIFVDAPLAHRLERVRSTRGWDEHELARREAAQWPLERKRAASGYVVTNAGDLPALAAALANALAAIQAAGPTTPRT